MTDDWQQSRSENVFEMFMRHGSAGFWVRRTTWGGTCARVVRIGAITGPPPYFGSPSVLMDVYSLQGGELKDSLVQLPAAGTYKTWRYIDPPEWSDRVQLRPLSDRSIDEALARLDKKRHKTDVKPRPTPEEAQSQAAAKQRVPLKVPFERKDEAKKLGARWSPADKFWWLPEGTEDAIAKARELGFLS